MPECNTNTDGITLELIVNIFKKHKWLMLFIALLSGIACAAIARFSPQAYRTNCVMLTEEHSYVAESMKMIGTQQGVNVGDLTREEDAIYPIYYPELLIDGRMQSFILNSRITDTNGKSMPYGQHIRKNKTRLRPKDLDATRPTILTDSLAKVLLKRVKLTVDGKTFVIKADVKDEDAMVAYTICDSMEHYLGRTIRTYRREKLEGKLEQAQHVEDDLAKRTRNAYEAYSDYADKHQGATLPSVSKHTEELFKQAEELKKLLDAARFERLSVAARLNDSTPPYIIIKKASIPSHMQDINLWFTIICTIIISILLILLFFLARPIYEQVVN